MNARHKILLLITACGFWLLGLGTVLAANWLRLYLAKCRFYARHPLTEDVKLLADYAECLAVFDGCVVIRQHPVPDLLEADSLIVAQKQARWVLIVERDAAGQRPKSLSLNLPGRADYTLFLSGDHAGRQVLVCLAPAGDETRISPVAYIDANGDGIFEEIRIGPAGSQIVYSFTGLGWTRVAKAGATRPAESLPAGE